MADVDNNQPAWKPGNQMGIPKFHAGGHKSVARLNQLRYDPIGELVEKYRKLEKELEYQEKLRSGEIVELNPQGKPRAYRAEIHHAIYDRLIAVSDKLLRYNYGRVPETLLVEEKKPLPLIVNLTKKGETYVVNDEQHTSDNFIGDDDDN